MKKVTAVTKDEALERFKERLGEQQNLLNALGTDNPFPYSFEVEVDAPERIAELTPQIGDMEGVETAKFGQEVVEQNSGRRLWNSCFRLPKSCAWAALCW